MRYNDRYKQDVARHAHAMRENSMASSMRSGTVWLPPNPDAKPMVIGKTKSKRPNRRFYSAGSIASISSAPTSSGDTASHGRTCTAKTRSFCSSSPTASRVSKDFLDDSRDSDEMKEVEYATNHHFIQPSDEELAAFNLREAENEDDGDDTDSILEDGYVTGMTTDGKVHGKVIRISMESIDLGDGDGYGGEDGPMETYPLSQNNGHLREKQSLPSSHSHSHSYQPQTYGSSMDDEDAFEFEQMRPSPFGYMVAGHARPAIYTYRTAANQAAECNASHSTQGSTYYID